MSKTFVCPNCGEGFRQHHQHGPNPPWCQKCAEKKYRKLTLKEKLAAAEARIASLEMWRDDAINLYPDLERMREAQ